LAEGDVYDQVVKENMEKLEVKTKHMYNLILLQAYAENISVAY